jgi:hypothetical protein
MFPSPEDKRMRASGVKIDAPLPQNEYQTPESVCAFITARLRYDFISGKETVSAYIDQTQPTDPPDSARPAAYISTWYISEREEAVLEILRDSDSPYFIDTADPMLAKFFCKVVVKSHYHGRYRISVSCTVTDRSAVLAA